MEKKKRTANTTSSEDKFIGLTVCDFKGKCKATVIKVICTVCISETNTTLQINYAQISS